MSFNKQFSADTLGTKEIILRAGCERHPLPAFRAPKCEICTFEYACTVALGNGNGYWICYECVKAAPPSLFTLKNGNIYKVHGVAT